MVCGYHYFLLICSLSVSIKLCHDADFYQSHAYILELHTHTPSCKQQAQHSPSSYSRVSGGGGVGGTADVDLYTDSGEEDQHTKEYCSSELTIKIGRASWR